MIPDIRRLKKKEVKNKNRKKMKKEEGRIIR